MQAKWTSTVNNRLLIDAGYGEYRAQRHTTYQPGVEPPYGSPAWKARYGRRNLSESRNGQLAGLGLKRLPSYGLARGTKEVQLGDFVVNLRTLGRLVREATAQAAP